MRSPSLSDIAEGLRFGRRYLPRIAPPTLHRGRAAAQLGTERIYERARPCRRHPTRARVVVFPELSLTGYELNADAVDAEEAALRTIVAACAETQSIALVGAPVAEHGRRFIATLRIGETGAEVAYRKSHLGGDEPRRFSPGDGPATIDVDGWRVGLGICKDTGVPKHIAATAALDIDVYVAGVVHLPSELTEQDARGKRIAATCDSYVVFASFAGPAGGGYDETSGHSTIWSPDGRVLARARTSPGDVAVAELPDSDTDLSVVA